MDAESMVILAPIFQVGWPSACATVAVLTRSFSQVRKGPPEAVSRIFSYLLGPAPCKHWKMALCSLSTGNSVPSGQAFITISPPATRVSLLASSTRLPACRAAMTDFRPTMPTTAASTSCPSASRATSARARGPKRNSQNFRSSGTSTGSETPVSAASRGRRART